MARGRVVGPGAGATRLGVGVGVAGRGGEPRRRGPTHQPPPLTTHPLAPHPPTPWHTHPPTPWHTHKHTHVTFTLTPHLTLTTHHSPLTPSPLTSHLSPLSLHLPSTFGSVGAEAEDEGLLHKFVTYIKQQKVA